MRGDYARMSPLLQGTPGLRALCDRVIAERGHENAATVALITRDTVPSGMRDPMVPAHLKIIREEQFQAEGCGLFE